MISPQLKKSYEWKIAKTPTTLRRESRYILAVWTADGFAFYKTFPITAHYRQKIRKIVKKFAPVPKVMDWEDIPTMEFVERPLSGVV